MPASALIEVRVLPWRLRARVMKASKLRQSVAQLDPTAGADDFIGLVVVLGVWLAILIAAPLIVLLAAGLIFSVELPILVIIALALVVARFAGLLPWTVVIVDRVTGSEQRESIRSLLRAIRRVREVNGERRVDVRWAWA